MIDKELVGYWTDNVMYAYTKESNELAFRPDGSGFAYWMHIPGMFSVQRFSWFVGSPGVVQFQFVNTLTGTWNLAGDDIEHRIQANYPFDTVYTSTYTVVRDRDALDQPATILTLDQTDLGIHKFAFRPYDLDDPTLIRAV